MFQQTQAGMMKKGWQFSDSDSECRSCHKPITWAKSPDGRNVSFDPGTATYHVKGCTGVPVRPASTVPPPAARPTTERAPGPVPAADARTPLQQSIDALTAEIKSLLAELKARRPAVEHRVGTSGEPYDVRRDQR